MGLPSPLYVTPANTSGGASGVTVIGPFNTVQTGAVGSGRLTDVSAPTLAALAAGALAWVLSVKDWWRWDPVSTLTSDGIKVLNPIANGANPGRFIRELVPAPEWMKQLNWFVDPANVAASDENDGATGATPLATDAERQRRMGPNPLWDAGGYHIRFISDLPVSDVVRVVGTVAQTATLFFHGSATNGQGQSVLYTVAADAVVIALNRATNTPWQIASAGLPVSWTASGCVNKRLRRTNGTAVKGWVVKDLGAKNARCSQGLNANTYTVPCNISNTLWVPANGDTFVVEKLTVVPSLLVNLQPTDDFSVNTFGFSVIFESLDLGGTGFNFNVTWGGLNPLVFDGCELSLWTHNGQGFIQYQCCQVKNFGAPPGFFNDFHAGYSRTNLQLGTGESIGRGNSYLFEQDFMCQGALFNVQDGGINFRDVAVFDTSSPFNFNTSLGGGFGNGTIWGSGNTGASVNIAGSGCVVQFLAGTTFNIVSATADVRICGRVTEHAYDDGAGVYTAPRATSFANLLATVAAGGFGNSMLSPVFGSGLVRNT
jgi:hypothetical protein